MAVAVQDLSMTAPYVHSDLYRFNRTDIGVKEKVDTIKGRFEAIADTYENYAQILENYEFELYNFLNLPEKTYQGLNRFLFEDPTSLNRIAQKVLQDPEFIYGIAPKITDSVIDIAVTIFKDPNLQSELRTLIKNSIQQNHASIFQLSQEIINALQLANVFPKKATTKSVFVNVDKVKDIFAVNPDILVNFSEKAKQSIKTNVTSKNSIFKTAINQALAKKNIKTTVDETVFKQQFIKVFDRIVSEFEEPLLVDWIDTAKINYANEAWAFYSANGAVGQRLAIQGDVGEAGLQLQFYDKFMNYNTSQTTITVIPTGHKNENQITDEIARILKDEGNKAKYQLKEFHNPKKQGMTDEIIMIHSPNGTKTFRVQSKNFGLRWLDEIEKGENKERTIVPPLEKGSTLQLIETLRNQQFIDGKQANELAYYIANLIWFRNQGSIQHYNTKKSRTRKQIGPGGLKDAQNLINRFFSEAISAFLGLTYTDILTASTSKIVPEASNIFFWLGNTELFPVSQVLREVAKQLRDVAKPLQGQTTSLFNLYYVIDTNVGALPTAREFYARKQFFTDHLNYDGDYTDPGLLNVGQSMGQTIMSRAQGYVNLNFYMSKILQSTYKFTK